MSSGSVDWEAIGNPLPIAQIPKERELRRALFDQLDVNKNSYLNLTEVMAGLPKLLEGGDDRRTHEASKYLVPLEAKDLRTSARAAFRAAQHVSPPPKGRRARHAADCIDRHEFHALLVAFMIHIELDLILAEMDRSEDKRVHWKGEVDKFVDKLEPWNITKKQCKAKLGDDWTPMPFKKFKEWCILRRFHGSGGMPLELDENDPDATLKDAAGVGNLGAVLKSFANWDEDKTGSISREELKRILMELDEKFTEEMADQIFDAADVNKDGGIDYVEFAAWLTAEPEED